MNHIIPEAEVHLSCAVCLQEIPRSAALTAEGADYVGEFCGLDCYQEFLKETDTARPAALIAAAVP